MKVTFTNLEQYKPAEEGFLILSVSQDTVSSSKQDIILYAKNSFDFKGDSNSIIMVPSKNLGTVILVGTGKEEKINELSAQKLGNKIAIYCNVNKIRNATIAIGCQLTVENNLASEEKDNLSSSVIFGIKLASYRFNKYFQDKLKGKEFSIQSLEVVCKNPKDVESSYKQLEIIANNVFFARDLVSEPCNTLNPESYADICQSLTKEGLKVEVLGEEEMSKLGMKALLGVGQGSVKESKLVVMTWNGSSNKAEQPIAFVGKGVTFDTGGISLKPSANMEDMKSDMGGSATVVGLMRLLAQRQAKVNAVGVVGLVENMPSGNAQRPGDVVTSMSGQTIEIINTDAEGRLVLADALHYTNIEFKPKFIVDLATLTGAIIVSLADIYAGLFSNNDDLSQQISSAGKQTGELVWRFPMNEEYNSIINSGIADMRNTGAGGRGAGSITAAQFLKRFIGDTKWAHLDIAGTAWKGKGGLGGKGATGFGVMLLNKLVEDNYEDSSS